MAVSTGSRLGPYEILASIGAGGMGEVYRARDTRLDRTVAVKVLPPHLSASPESRQRFEREAKTISQLSHPHICALYDVGNQDGIDYLVMELLEGETLSDRLAKGALPLDQSLKYGQQIADALDKAHRQGIVHRDLKPGNVMLTKSGVKLLDFGLAKVFEPPAAKAALTSLPTKVALTQEGTILGTFQHMAPEQLEGKEADARTDIFALGTVLYEMATGKKAFSASSQASLITAIMSADPPPISTLQPMSPPALERLVKTCFAKDPEERWQSAADIRRELEWIAGGSAAEVALPSAVAGRRRSRERLAWSLLAAALAAVAVLGALLFSSRRERPRMVRSSILPPEKSLISGEMELSPDGERLAFVAPGPAGTNVLWVRPLRELSAQPLAVTDGGSSPFWSPDGKSLGFFANGKLKRVEVSGGPPQTLADAPYGRGGTWNRDGVILFAPSLADVIFRVPSSGGAVSPVTERTSKSERGHRWPYFLPDGKHFLYLGLGAASGAESDVLFLGSLDSRESKSLLNTRTSAAYAPDYLLFYRENTLLARPFDPKRLRFAGEAVPVAQGVRALGNRRTAFSVSQNGILTYQAGKVGIQARLVWFDRAGKELERLAAPANHFAPRLSHDGRRVALTAEDPSSGTDLWIYDFPRKTSTRFTFDPANEFSGVWAPDDRRILYGSSRNGPGDVYWRDTAGTTNEEPLLTSPTFKVPTDWSLDGRFVVFQQAAPKTGDDLWVLSIADRKASPFLQTEFRENNARFSPDGRFLAYVSSESGTDEVYVQAFPGPGGKWQISTGGGTQPVWSRDGRELFYVAPPSRMLAVEIRVGTTLEPGIPKLLFETLLVGGPGLRMYDVSPDGQRFLVSRPLDEAQMPITLVENWAAELKR